MTAINAWSRPQAEPFCKNTAFSRDSKGNRDTGRWEIGSERSLRLQRRACYSCLFPPCGLRPLSAHMGRPPAWYRASARAGPPSPMKARSLPGPDRLPARPCRSPMPSPRSSEPPVGFRPPAQTRQRSPEGLKPVRRLAPARQVTKARTLPTGAGTRRERQALCRRQELASRKGGAIPSRQLPRMRPRSDRGMSQGGWTAVRLGLYLGLLPSQ